MASGASHVSRAISPVLQMEQNARHLVPLRVLYTLNTSPQYLLARQRHSVEAVPVSENERNNHSPGTERVEGSAPKQRYARVSLKSCLEAVCNASPELVCDRSRDYSVYVVDPLESLPNDDNAIHGTSQAPTDTSFTNASSLSEGVSIGMGLMSWCLAGYEGPHPESKDSDMGYIVGRLVKDRGADALEVIMSLRETVTQTQHQHALSLSSWGSPMLSTTLLDADGSSTLIPSPSQPSSMRECLRASHAEMNKNDAVSSGSSPALGSTSQPLEQSSRAKSKKIGRPQGAKTHPEKRARQLAIQMHKEKLERLRNIVKMQNGEKYDKTLIIASECETKVTEEIIAREQKLLEELQSRPLIVDGPRFTTQPLLRRVPSSTTQKQPMETDASKRTKRPTVNAVSSNPNSIRNNVIVEVSSTPAESKQAATNEGREAGHLLALLGSVLGKLDEPAAVGVTPTPTPGLGNEKGKRKETHPVVNEDLAQALRKLLPYFPNHANQSKIHSVTAHTALSTDTQSDTVVPKGGNSQAAGSTSHAQISYPRFFQTAEESFYPKPERGANWLYDKHWTTKAVASKVVPKVREDAHPVPGGGWARGKHIVPRATAPLQIETASSGDTQETNAATRPDTSTTIVASEKENMPPAKHKRGLKRSFSSSGDAKENATSEDALLLKSGQKRRKPEDATKPTKSKAVNRAMMGSGGTNEVTSRTFPASSPVRSRIQTSPSRSLPVVAVSEPDFLLPTLIGAPSATSRISPNSPTGSSSTISRSGGPSDELNEHLISHTASVTSPDPPKTPPGNKRVSDDDNGGSLFTPSAISASEIAEVLPQNSHIPGSLSPIISKSPGHSSRRPLLIEAEVENQGVTLASRHVGTGWDLPPSSPPPPTSPIMFDNDLGHEDHMDWDLTMQLQSELNVDMEKTSADRRFEDYGTTTTSAVTSIPVAGVHTLYDGSPHQLSALQSSVTDFDASSDDIFNLGGVEQIEGGQQRDSGDGTELDIDELWSSLGPVIAQAQLDSGSHAGTEFGHYDFANDQILGLPEEQGAVDPVRLADDLKAPRPLFPLF